MHLEHLKSLKQWAVSKPVVVDGRTTKPPFQTNGRLAKSTDPSTWCTYDVAKDSPYPYYGFMLSESDPYTIIDLDEPANAEQAERHKTIISILDSYTEFSVSGKGVHIIVKGHIPKGVHRDNVEMYSTARFMVFTEEPIRNKPIENRQELISNMFEQMNTTNEASLVELDELISDEELVAMGERAENGDKFMRLCRGEWQGDYPSQSEADLALMSILAFYTKSNEQVRRLFRMSALGKRAKAQRDRYLDYALERIRGNEPPPVDIENIPSFELDPLKEQAASMPTGESFESFQETVVNAVAEKTGLTGGVLTEPFETDIFPPGLMGDVARYIYETAVRPVKQVGLAAAIGLFAGICGRGYNISGTGLNQYVILLAGTGTGKDGITAGIDRLLIAMRQKIPVVDRCIGPAGFASGQALVRALDNQPCFVSILGEFGITLQQLCDQRANVSQLMLKRALLDLYSRSGFGKVLRSNVYADSDKNTKVINSPCVTLLGESTPETFYSHIDETHIQEGLVPRFSIIEYKGPRPARNKQSGAAPHELLVASMCAMATTALSNEQRSTVTIPRIDEEAATLLDAFDIEADAKINESSNEIDIQLWNRAHLKTLKLAALVAVGVNHANPVIDVEAARWAVGFVRTEVEAVANHYMTGKHGTGDSRQEADLRAAITAYRKLSHKKRKQYGVPEKVIREHKIIPYSYLRNRLIKLKSFKDDRRGATNAVKGLIKDMSETDVLRQVPPLDAIAKYKTRIHLYYRGEEW